MPRERLSVWFEGPRTIGVRADALPDPPAGKAQVRTRLAMISAGTELAAWRGDLDPDMARDETIPALAGGGFRFPFRYGYATVGEVEAVGPGVARESLPPGPVFAFAPHQTRFHADPAELLPVPDGMPVERGVSFPHVETAVNLLLDGPPRVGDRALVIGQGMLGLTLTALLARFPLGDLAAVEPRRDRRALALRLGAKSALTPEAAESRWTRRADRVFEVSGSAAGLNMGIDLVARDGTLVAGSWLGKGETALRLGGWFHRGRVKVVSSQVSHLPPLGPGWSVERRRNVAWALLGELPLEELPMFRVPFEDAAAAYARLDRGEALTATLAPSS